MKILYLGCLAFFISSCLNLSSDLTLDKIEIDHALERDTLEKYPDKGLYIVQIIHEGTFGRFSIDHCIIKDNNGKLTAYEMDSQEYKRISKDFVALVSTQDKPNWGWFYVNNGKISTELPGISVILDSLDAKNIKSDFSNVVNGYISFYLKGKVVKDFNYGRFVTKYGDFNFDNLDYGVYKLNKDRLEVVSRNGDDIFKQKEGVFFIPPPGYGVIHKYKKTQILNAVDSASKLENPPGTIKIKAFN